MNATDKKILNYLLRAEKVYNEAHQATPNGTFGLIKPDNVIEVAKMIHMEEIQKASKK